MATYQKIVAEMGGPGPIQPGDGAAGSVIIQHDKTGFKYQVGAAVVASLGLGKPIIGPDPTKGPH
jgi:hypothetical protein